MVQVSRHCMFGLDDVHVVEDVNEPRAGGLGRGQPVICVDLVQREAQRLVEAATWLGQITALANHFPNPAWVESMPKVEKYRRDSQGRRVRIDGRKRGARSSSRY